MTRRQDKKPKSVAQPEPQKKPKGTIFAENLPLGWRFSACDNGGPWPWAALAAGDLALYHHVINRLAELERMNWNDILRTGSHPIDTSDICKEANDRLVAIRKDDIEELFSVRIDNHGRVWCIRDVNMMNVLWWDPDHTVYPTRQR